MHLRGHRRLKRRNLPKLDLYDPGESMQKRFLRKGETEELSDELIAEEPDHASDHDVREALMLLGEDDRLIVAWSVLGGYSSEEIGKILEMNPATVRSRKSRALEQMHRILEN